MNIDIPKMLIRAQELQKGEDNNPQITNEEQISITANYIHKYISGQI